MEMRKCYSNLPWQLLMLSEVRPVIVRRLRGDTPWSGSAARNIVEPEKRKLWKQDKTDRPREWSVIIVYNWIQLILRRPW